MNIGIMNNPSKSVYDEAVFCGKACFDFLDLTIEGPDATTVDVTKLRPILDCYGLSIIFFYWVWGMVTALTIKLAK